MFRDSMSKAFGFLLVLTLAAPIIPACGTDDPEPEGISPFSVTLRLRGTTVEEATRNLTAYIQSVDDTGRGLPADWKVAGADKLEAGQDAFHASLKLPGGNRIVEVCNHHYAAQAMSFGGHHGVGLPCEIAVNQEGDDVEIVMLNPEGIFSAFFSDIPPEHAAQLGGLAAVVRGELEGLLAAAFDGRDLELLQEDVGPRWDSEKLESFTRVVHSIDMNMDIPATLRSTDDDRQAFQASFVDTLLETLTHEGMQTVGSQVEGLSVNDWRSARTYALGLPGGVSVVEVCSPTYAGAALQTGAHHAPALPCQMAIWVEGDTLRVSVLDPMFVFSTFFADAPEEMLAQMGGMAETVRNDILAMVQAAQQTLLAD